MNKLKNVSIDDIGYAIVINIDYRHHNTSDARDYFQALHAILISQGFNFDDRFFYRLGTKEQIKDLVKSSISHLESISPLSKSFLRSIHLIPLSQFSDVTAELTAAAI